MELIAEESLDEEARKAKEITLDKLDDILSSFRKDTARSLGGFSPPEIKALSKEARQRLAVFIEKVRQQVVLPLTDLINLVVFIGKNLEVGGERPCR